MTNKPQFVGERVRLGDVATYINGYAFKPTDYASEGKPIIRIQDLTGNAYQTNRFAGVLDDKYRIRCGDVLISWSASLGVYEWGAEEAWLNQHIFKVQFNKLPVNKRFFIHQTRYVIAESSSLAHGATMRHLTKKVFDNLPFFYPSEDDQDEISCRLDGIQLQIERAEGQIAKLDQLVKSRFVEMFENGKTDTVRLGDWCEKITKGTTPTTAGYSFIDDGINFIKVETLSDSGDFIPDKLAHISCECHAALKRSQLKEGDLLFSIAGAIGRIAIVTSDVMPANTNQALAIIRLNKNAPFELSFLKQALSSSAVVAVAEKLKRGVAQINLSLKDVGNFLIPCPDMETQRDYSACVSQVDKSRFVAQQQIEKLQMLYDSLAQEYFGD